jgi:hypothetical protein
MRAAGLIRWCSLQVLSAAAKYADQNVAASKSEAPLVGDVEMGDTAQQGIEADLTEVTPLVQQQLLCSFIELAANIKGEAAIKALESVGALLAAQKPLILVTEHTPWIIKLLEWLGDFLTLCAPDGAQKVRGMAAGAMLDLGVCSGSLRCILGTLNAILSQV